MMGLVGLVCLYSAVRLSIGSGTQTRYENQQQERPNELPIIPTPTASESAAPSAERSHLVSHSQNQVEASNSTSVVASGETQRTSPQAQPMSAAPYLVKILGQYGLLASVISNLRCADIYNLLHLSKDIRSVILGTVTTPRGLLEKSLCDPRNPFFNRNSARTSTCSSCSTIICPHPHCTHLAPPPGLRDCKPHCSTCLYRSTYRYSTPRTQALVSRHYTIGYPFPAQLHCRWDESEYLHSMGVRVCAACFRTKSETGKKWICTNEYDSHLGSGVGSMVRTRGEGSRVMGMDRGENSTGGNGYEVLKVKYFTCAKCNRGIHTGDEVRWGCTWCGKECVARRHLEENQFCP